MDLQPVSYTHLDVYKRQHIGYAQMGQACGLRHDAGDTATRPKAARAVTGATELGCCTEQRGCRDGLDGNMLQCHHGFRIRKGGGDRNLPKLYTVDMCRGFNGRCRMGQARVMSVIMPRMSRGGHRGKGQHAREKRSHNPHPHAHQSTSQKSNSRYNRFPIAL